MYKTLFTVVMVFTFVLHSFSNTVCPESVNSGAGGGSVNGYIAEIFRQTYPMQIVAFKFENCSQYMAFKIDASHPEAKDFLALLLFARTNHNRVFCWINNKTIPYGAGDAYDVANINVTTEQ